MKRTNYLLPHLCQWVGVWLGLAAWAAIILFKVLAPGWVAEESLLPAGGYLYTILAMMMCVAVLLITFSEEKYEDEMIVAVRKSTITTVAYAVFMVFVVASIVWYADDICLNLRQPADTWNQVNSKWLRDILNLVKDPFVIFVFYQAVFRTRLPRLKKALTNEE